MGLASKILIQSAFAQRSLGANTIVLDDGSGHTITLKTPANGWTGNIPFVIPIPPAGNPPSGFVHVGTALGQILTWNPADGVQGAWDATSFAAAGAITGTGTSGSLPLWTGSSTQGNSLLTDNGTTLSYSGTHINTAVDYQIAGSTVVSNPGSGNMFVGVDAGFSNTTGWNHTLIGAYAGDFVTGGYQNTFVGSDAGPAMVNGVDNVFVGSGSGWVTTSWNNTFIGTLSGWTNAGGDNNTMLGHSADVASSGLTNATAIGSGAIVAASNSIQLGNTNVTLVNTSGTLQTSGGIAETSGTTVLSSAHNTDVTTAVPANTTVYTVDNGGGNGPTSLTLPTGTDGQVLYVYNNDATDAITVGSVTLTNTGGGGPHGVTLIYFHSVGWEPVGSR